jgi:membrane protease YdiL (CAAX protease family)
MAKLWPWTLIISVISFVVAVEIAIFGQPLSGLFGAETAYAIQFFLGLAMLILAIVALPAANAHDAQKHAGVAR